LKMPPTTLHPETTTASNNTNQTETIERVGMNTSFTLSMVTSRHS
jgi:hypothetical protein